MSGLAGHSSAGERAGNTGAFSRLTFEVNQDDWMRFHTGAQEVCVSPSFGGLIRLTRCN
ncbi:MAG TPA: hypothetical protein VKG01_11990 [Thermoanaerobaculia bacterium]|nr:hypothetical protein [Thermoanaerobaculia bacterium]